MKIWAVANQKGGVGKTTSTVSLAGLLAGRGEDTLIIDLDPHGSMSSYFGIDPETVNGSVYDLYQNAISGEPHNYDRLIHNTDFDHLFLMPASTALSTIEKQLGSQNGMGLVLSQALEQLTDRYRYVLIDCPPMLGMLMVSALAACEQLIVPVQTEHLAIKGLQRMLRTLTMIERSLKTELAYTILPTMYDKRTMASKQSLQQMRSDYPEHMYSSVIPVDTKFRDASHVGKPLSYMAPATHGSVAYEELLSVLLPDADTTSQAIAL